jgi:hypothetical protein
MNQEDLIEGLKPLIEQIQQLYKLSYATNKPKVDYLIHAKIKDENTIGHLLDTLLDSCADEQVLLLFKKLCRYYWTINPVATAEYVNIYREMWDNEDMPESDN